MKTSEIALASGTPENANMRSIVAGLETMGDKLGLGQPHRAAHYLAQIAHESGAFKWDRELWGATPTAAQRKYEGRKDLGNVVPGDGYKFRGRTAGQITGRGNTTEFRDWCRIHVSPDAPDFAEDPDKMNTDPWEGLGPLWYWSSRNLGVLADGNHIEAITKRINGGLNGYADRRRYYARFSLVMLGYAPADVRGFQRAAELTVDGDSGQLTEAALHARLRALPLAPWGPQPDEPAGPASNTLANLWAAVRGLQQDVASLKATVY